MKQCDEPSSTRGVGENSTGDLFSSFRHEAADDTEAGHSRRSEALPGPTKRPREHTVNSGGEGRDGGSGGVIYRTSAERREAAMQKWGYVPDSTSAPSAAITVSNVRSVPAGPSGQKLSSFSDSSAGATVAGHSDSGAEADDEDTSTSKPSRRRQKLIPQTTTDRRGGTADLSSLDAFRFSGQTDGAQRPPSSGRSGVAEFPLEASRRHQAAAAASGNADAVIDEIEDLQSFSHRPQPQQLQPSSSASSSSSSSFRRQPLHQQHSARQRFPLHSSSSSSSGGGGSGGGGGRGNGGHDPIQLRRPWPGAGIDDEDEDDDEIEEDYDPISFDSSNASSRIGGGGGGDSARGGGGRRRSSVEDGIETSDDEGGTHIGGGGGGAAAAAGDGMRHSRLDSRNFGENCKHRNSL
jgi:hypothetical protein